jgi:PadR family transcriptional regulator, regulatory protein PadR
MESAMPQVSEQSHAHWLSQVRRGLLELCILSLLGQQPMYGYQIVKRLTEVPGLVITEGTIYPLLSRLKSQGHVTSTLTESPYGPARRTYVLTEGGSHHLRSITQGWQDIVQAVNQCLDGTSLNREANHETT